MLSVGFLGWAVARRGLEARGGFPFLTQEPLAGRNPASTCLCTSPCSEGCAVSEQELQGLQEGAGETLSL